MPFKKGKIWLRNFKPVIFTEECVHHYTYLPLSKRDKDRQKRRERENNGIFLSPIVTNEYLVRNQWLKTDGSYVLTCCWYSLQKICTKSVVVVMLMKCLMMDDLPFTYLLALSLPPSSPLSIRCIEEVLHTVGFYTFSNTRFLYFFATR